MIGPSAAHISRNGRILLSLSVLTLVLFFLLSGCSAEWWVGDGRGDWDMDLCGGYEIVKINSKEIKLGYKEIPDDSGWAIPLDNYFITAYQLYEPYICLEGIRTQRMSITEEELNARVLSYYLVDSTNNKMIGPYESYDDFVEGCKSLALEIEDNWIKITNSGPLENKN